MAMDTLSVCGKEYTIQVNTDIRWTQEQSTALRGWLALAPVARDRLFELNGKSLVGLKNRQGPLEADSYVFVKTYTTNKGVTFYLQSACGGFFASIFVPA